MLWFFDGQKWQFILNLTLTLNLALNLTLPDTLLYPNLKPFPQPKIVHPKIKPSHLTLKPNPNT